MRRVMRAGAGAIGVLLAGMVAVAADPPAGAEYYPLKDKSKWAYKATDQTVEMEVAGADKDGTKLDTKVNGKTVASEVVAVKPDGVYRVSVKGEKVDPPVKILAFPVKKDDEWPVDSKVGTSAVKGKFKVKAVDEKVKVPAGEFADVVLVEGADFDIAGTKTTIRYYFAKTKGVIRLAYEIQGTKTELELKDYAEGK